MTNRQRERFSTFCEEQRLRLTECFDAAVFRAEARRRERNRPVLEEMDAAMRITAHASGKRKPDMDGHRA